MFSARSLARFFPRPALRLALLTTALVAIAALSPLSIALGDGPHSAGPQGKPGPEPATLKVLYAGNPGSDREQDFVALLKKHFGEVGTGDFQSFKAEEAKDFDVVVFDWTSIYPRDEQGKINMEDSSIASPTAPELPPGFGKPVVMIGAAAGTVSHKVQSAINWKCLCLENRAHDVATDHPIFHGPLAVELELVEETKPFDYWAYPGTQKLDETIRVWKVQEKTFPEVDPGLVSTRETFVSVPDAEIISGGINGKGPTSVAIGRHGNFFLWGFSGQPSHMTESARGAFVNAICYMQQYDGQTPQQATQPNYYGRDAYLARLYSLRMLSDLYVAKQAENFRQMMKEMPVPEEQRKQVGDDPAKFFRDLMTPHIEPIREKIPSDVRDRFSDDTEAILRHYTENFEYLRSQGDGTYVVDEDVQALGVSNRSRELLDKCVALLEAGEKTQLAERVLERYTGQKLDGAEAWRQFVASGGDSFRFDENEAKFYLVP